MVEKRECDARKLIEHAFFMDKSDTVALIWRFGVHIISCYVVFSFRFLFLLLLKDSPFTWSIFGAILQQYINETCGVVQA